jgi:hypothetical protein
MKKYQRSEPGGSLLSRDLLARNAHVGLKSLKDNWMGLVLRTQRTWNETCLKTDCEEAPLIPHR